MDTVDVIGEPLNLAWLLCEILAYEEEPTAVAIAAASIGRPLKAAWSACAVPA